MNWLERNPEANRLLEEARKTLCLQEKYEEDNALTAAMNALKELDVWQELEESKPTENEMVLVVWYNPDGTSVVKSAKYIGDENWELEAKENVCGEFTWKPMPDTGYSPDEDEWYEKRW